MIAFQFHIHTPNQKVETTVTIHVVTADMSLRVPTTIDLIKVGFLSNLSDEGATVITQVIAVVVM